MGEEGDDANCCFPLVPIVSLEAGLPVLYCCSAEPAQGSFAPREALALPGKGLADLSVDGYYDTIPAGAIGVDGFNCGLGTGFW